VAGVQGPWRSAAAVSKVWRLVDSFSRREFSFLDGV